jgi:hypothetical protein
MQFLSVAGGVRWRGNRKENEGDHGKRKGMQHHFVILLRCGQTKLKGLWLKT